MTPTRPMRLILPAILAAHVIGTVPAQAGGGFCPPGLAKKSPACVPPGQAQKHRHETHERLRRGDSLHDHDHYHLIRHPDRYGLDPLRPGERYYVVDGRILRVDRETYEVLDVIRAVSALLD
ncbi:excinuclease ABC subunit A [Albidovulum sp.]|uniref:excinuclease ABC subunit A n=1 Tax=Albidovulum sp. TaxID=1872424 RepID=UPI0039B96083